MNIPEGWKLVPVADLIRWRDAFHTELVEWDIDPPLHHVKSSYDEICALLAAPTPPVQQCRSDGRCQYAIDHDAEGMGHCPPGKCVMPAQQCEPAGWLDGPYGEFRRNPAFRVTGPGSVAWSLPVFLAPTVQQDDEALEIIRDLIADLERVGSDGWMTGQVHSNEYRAAVAFLTKRGAA